jgi:hypothetical protein
MYRWLVGLIVLLVTHTAGAQPQISLSASDAATRQIYLQRAHDALRAGNGPSALEWATRAGEMKMTPSVRVFIAQRQAELGAYTEAHGNAALCMDEAERDTHLADRGAILRVCASLVARLRAHIGMLTVHVAGAVPSSLQVRVAGRVIRPTSYGAPVAVNAGTVMVEAVADGYRPLRYEIRVNAEENAEATLALERVPTSRAAVPVLPTAVRSKSAFKRRPSIGPWLVMGTGAAALGVSLALYFVRNDAIATLESACVPPDRLRCTDTPTHREQLSTITSLNTWTNIAFIGGSLFTTAGLTYLAVEILAASKQRGRDRFHITATPGGIVFGGEL